MKKEQVFSVADITYFLSFSYLYAQSTKIQRTRFKHFAQCIFVQTIRILQAEGVLNNTNPE